MVQFIPSAPGTTPYAPTGLSQMLGGIGGVLGQSGQAMGGVADLLKAIHGRQPTWKYMGMPAPSAPLAPGAQGPAAPPNPLGPMANMPFNKLKDLNDSIGSGGVSNILNQGNNMTVYWDPVNKTASFTPVPGGIPINGMKPSQALQDVSRSAYQSRKMDFEARLAKLKGANLSPEQRLKLGMAHAYAQVLGNPMIDLPQETATAFMTNLEATMKELEGDAGMGGGVTPTSDTPSPKAGAGGRTKVKGPNGQTGTIPKGSKLPKGWSLG